MITPRINYLLTACSHRAYRDVNTKPPGKDILKIHMRQLLKTNVEALSQLTIVRPLPLNRGAFAEEYWDISDCLEQLRTRCCVETLDVADAWWSYSSWIQAIQKWLESFDYYILMEDDFYPAHPRFVEILVRKHKQHLPDGGYLSTFLDLGHGALSNGIVDSKTALEGFGKYEDPIHELSPGAQVLFSHLFFGDKVADFADEFRTLTFAGETVQELSHNFKEPRSTDLINPVQFLYHRHGFG